MIKKIDHIGIMTNDLQQSVKFYTDVLGFSVFRKIEMAELSAVFVEKNGSKIELMKYKGKNVPKRSEGAKLRIGVGSIPINDHITFSAEDIEATVIQIPINDHITFSVDDIEATVFQLKEKGVVFTLEPIQLEDGMKLTSFEDPNGVLIELVEHPR